MLFQMLNLMDQIPDQLADSRLEKVAALYVVLTAQEMVAVVDLNLEIEELETLKLSSKHPQDMEFDIALMQTIASAKLHTEQGMQEDHDNALKKMGQADLGVGWAQAECTDILDPVSMMGVVLDIEIR